MIPLSAFQDPVLTPEVWALFQGALVSDLFDDSVVPYTPQATVLTWSWSGGLQHHEVDLSGLEGEVLRFGVEIRHNGIHLCDPVHCPNWPFVYTPRIGNRFRLSFTYHEGFSETRFRWIKEP